MDEIVTRIFSDKYFKENPVEECTNCDGEGSVSVEALRHDVECPECKGCGVVKKKK